MGKPCSEATKAKIRQSKLGKKASPEARANMSAVRKGRKKPFRSRPWQTYIAEDVKSKISATLTGKHPRLETRLKMSDSRRGVPKTSTTRQRMSDSRKDKSLPGNRRRNEATSRRNVRQNLEGKGFLVKGYHFSSKTPSSPVPYRSKSIELRLMLELDADPAVLSWESPLCIAYKGVDGTIKHALPDFFVTFTDGSQKVIEGKGPHLLARYKTSEKFTAVADWCREHRVAFDIISTSDRGRELARQEVV